MDWLKLIETISVIIGLIIIFWKMGKWQGETDIKLDSINNQVNNHIPTQLKDLDTKITCNVSTLHERINKHDKEIGVLQGKIEK